MNIALGKVILALSLAALSSTAAAIDFSVTRATLSGPSIICTDCPPGGEATYTVALEGTGYKPAYSSFTYAVYDDDPLMDDLLIRRTDVPEGWSTNSVTQTWSTSFEFKLFCNESTHCDVAGANGDSWETDPLIFAKLEGSWGGDYAVTNMLQVFCTPVPEPETWALMAAGLAMMFATTRRQRHHVRALA